MRMSLKFAVLVLAFTGFGLGAGLAAGKVWVGLYLAENGPPPPNAVHYELVKGQEVLLHNEWQQWFVPRHDFFIRVEPLHRIPGQPRLIDYEIYKDGFMIAKGTYQPHEGTPLFINGPDFHKGRFIFVIEPRRPKNDSDDDD
jgi:hypothetical protein